jgi:RNA polymerase sigma-70 factor (ECF subfamily)
MSTLAVPDAFAALYRRHVDALLGDLRRRDPAHAADLTAETFAAALDEAHRFDPARGREDEWLSGIAGRQLEHVARHGAVDQRARRRLGLAALPESDRFVDDLEEELVEAARFLATRRRLPIRLPRVDRRSVVAAVAAVAAVAIAAAAVALLARGGGADGDATGDAAPPPPPNAAFSLVAMRPLMRCPDPPRIALPDLEEFGGIALLARPQRGGDRLPFPPDRLPIGAFDPDATRRAPARQNASLFAVPSPRVASFGGCRGDDGPGVCLVASRRTFRCFDAGDVRGGRAVARTPEGTLVGIVPDGVGRVTLSAAGPSVTADVLQNVFEAQLAAVRGTPLEVAMQRDDGCRQVIAPELRAEIAALREQEQPSLVLPAAALGVVRAWAGRIDAAAAEEARLWGTRDGVDFWVVPVVPSGRGPCAPASRVCVVAVPEDSFADGACVLGDDDERWRLAPLLPGRAAIYGVVPDGVTRVRVTIGDVSAEVDARDNVVGGVLPFPYSDTVDTDVQLLR